MIMTLYHQTAMTVRILEMKGRIFNGKNPS